MDIKLSEKATMYQPTGPVDVLVSGIFDFYLIEHTDEYGQKWIDDVEILDNNYAETYIGGVQTVTQKNPGDLEEEQDRVLFAILRQRGQDPIAPGEGIQWAESLLSEIPVPLLMSQITNAASDESSYVNVGFQSIPVNGQPQLSISINTMDISSILQGYPNV